jgi:peptide/nickel transport system substrate-binding protein
LLPLLALSLACRAAPPERTLTLAVRADVISFFPNPPGLADTYTRNINSSIFEGLVTFDRDLSLRPALAESWINPDPLTTVFVLRPGLRFSTGQLVTAQDVVASIEASIRLGWETQDFFHTIESLRALDERRLEVRSRMNTFNLLTRLYRGFVLPREVLEKQPVPAIGTGPYRLERWEPGREILLVRNPYFRGPTPAFSRVRYLVVPDDAARVDLVRHGNAEIADEPPPELVAALRGRPDVRVITLDSPEALFLCPRLDRKPFSDPRVREAFDLALDRDEIVLRAARGAAEPAGQIVPHTIVGHDPQLQKTRLDRERARKLLREAGYAAGLTVRLDGPYNRYANDRRILDEVARELAEVGVTVAVNALDKAEFYKLIDSGASDLHLLGWSCSNGDAGDILEGLLHSRQGQTLGVWNTLGLSDPALDRLIDASIASPSKVERYRYLRQATDRVAEIRAVLPLVFPTVSFVASPTVEWEPPLDAVLRPAEVRPAR